MTDQGWMVDDGTCTPCLLDRHHRCLDPFSFDIGTGTALMCCCNEGYEVSWQPYDEEA